MTATPVLSRLLGVEFATFCDPESEVPDVERRLDLVTPAVASGAVQGTAPESDEGATAVGTVTQLRPDVRVDRANPSTCECPHTAHRPVAVFGATSRFRATGELGHASGARLRLIDSWVEPADGTSPRVCWTCHLAGHGDHVEAVAR